MAKGIYLAVSLCVAFLFFILCPGIRSNELTFQIIHQIKGQNLYDGFGASVAGISDVNLDGIPDFIIGARGADPNGLSYAGSAYVLSGIDGSLIHQKNGADSMDFLGTVAGIGDINGDRTPDFIVGAHGTNVGEIDRAGSAFIYSGNDGSLLYRKDGTESYGIFGGVVGSAGDINGDGNPISQ